MIANKIFFCQLYYFNTVKTKIMKKINVVISALAISAAVFGMFSCKKNDSKNNATCKMTSAVITPADSSNASTYNFTYNNDNKLSSIVVTGDNAFSKTFSYSGNTIKTTVKDGTGVVTGLEEIVLNNLNKISSITTEDATGAIKSVQTFYFDANGNAQKAIIVYASGTSDTSDFTFVDGNLLSIKEPNSSAVTTLSYYTDKSWASGDYLNFYQFSGYGSYYFINKNSVKSLSFGAYSNDFTYEYDSAGRITKVSMKNNGILVASYSYTYDCK
jgi:hypothetical protein